MDKKIELQILNISNSQAQIGAYALLLGEIEGDRQIPIIIGSSEAQATALRLKGSKAPRPLTHDLFHAIMVALGAKMIQMLIYKVEEGVFYSYIYIEKHEEVLRVDSCTSDAIALAVRAECPIYIYDSILEKEGIRTEDLATDNPIGHINRPSTQYTTLEALEKALAEAIRDENYELAALLRDELNQRK